MFLMAVSSSGKKSMNTPSPKALLAQPLLVEVIFFDVKHHMALADFFCSCL